MRDDSTYGHRQMVNTKIKLIMFFAAKDGKALNSQQKQDWELTVAQIMNSLLPNSPSFECGPALVTCFWQIECGGSDAA